MFVAHQFLADWLFSNFAYWQIPSLDADFGSGSTDEDTQYRSPELFHEFIAGGNRTKWGVYAREYYAMFTVRSPKKLLALFGPENVMFLRNEDMLPSVVDKQGGVLDQISNFTGLDRSGFPTSSYSSVVNCNDKKGVYQICGQTRSSSYAITGGREMLPETRKLIYLQFWEECKIWAKDFGIVYPDCLNIMD